MCEFVTNTYLNDKYKITPVNSEFLLQTPPAGNKSQYEEIDIPVALLSYTDMLDISKVRGCL